jgi:alkylated DNA nucleotide flippase Atl1
MVKPRYAYLPDHVNRTKAADGTETQAAPDCPHRGNEAAAAICAVIHRIPKGWVATYGQVAAMAGLPKRARLVGRVLQHLDPATDIPWHRVVNAKGEVVLHPLPQWQRRCPAAFAERGRRRVRPQEPLQLGAISLARIEIVG